MMSEPETKLEIEDVLSSIRRLVSRDAGVVRASPLPHRAPVAVVPEPEPAPVFAPALEPLPEVEAFAMTEAVTEAEAPAEVEPVPEMEAASEVACLVLSPALRIEDEVPEAGPEAVPEQFAVEPEPAPEPMLFVQPEPEAEAALSVEPALPETVDAEQPEQAAPAMDAEIAAAPSFAEELPPEALFEDVAPLAAEAAFDEAEPAHDMTAPLLLQPADVVTAGADALVFVSPEPPPMTEPRPMTEAESLLAEAEAALAETGALLDTATTAIGAVEEAEVAPITSMPSHAVDLGDELSRLESTIAELEAAVAESGAEFEPEEGHPFSAAGAEPLVDLPESFEETELHAAEAASADFDEADLDEAMAAEMAPVDAAELRDPNWAQDAGVGMDWAEATLNLARRTPSRRLAVSEAEETMQHVAAPRSSYDELRDELAQQEELEAQLYGDHLPDSYEETAMVDETALREMVAQMVRDELRGTLGERITQSVRKLVRREIQRALIGQDYE